MQSLTHTPAAPGADPAAEAERLAAELDARNAELTASQERLRAFKARYAQTVGALLSELSEVEAEIRKAEARLAGLAEDEPDAEAGGESSDFYARSSSQGGKAGLRKLFWSVARLFHPDHASDGEEARRRHSIMAEASRAYEEGDVDSLHTLLGDEQLQFYCASASRDDDYGEDPATRLLNLKEELRTTEFGIKRVRQDRLYQLMLRDEEEAREGRDVLAQMAQEITRKIRKARNRLAHLS